MEELTVTQIIGGMQDESMKEQKLLLVQCLANKIGEMTEPLEAHEKVPVFAIGLSSLQGKLSAANIDLYLSLLSNATIIESNARSFMEFINSKEQLLKHFKSFIDMFLLHNPQIEAALTSADSITAHDPWQNVSSILCNLCQLEEGRELLLRKSSGYMERIVIQIRSSNPVRRRGVIGCIRSCLFDQDIHWWMMVDIKVMDYILMPLIVAIPFSDKEKEGMNPLLWMQAENSDAKVEPHRDIMKMLLECIVLLCQRRGVREQLRKLKAYCVVKNLDLWVDEQKEKEQKLRRDSNAVSIITATVQDDGEDNDYGGVSPVIYEIVNLLMGDEDENTPIDKYEVKNEDSEK